MKFDVIVGNPPYQDGSQLGGQNKIYNQFSRKSLDLMKFDGMIAMITPVSVLKPSKRFSLIGLTGLREVNFSATNNFNVGVDICYWVVDSTYTGDVDVVSSTNEKYISSNKSEIYDKARVDCGFHMLYERLKLVTDVPNKRMFKQNAASTTTGRSKVADAAFPYPMYKLDKDRNEQFVQYNKKMPYFYKSSKFIICMTKTFDENCCTVSDNDFDVAYLCTDFSSIQQVDNMKSFLFCDYFIEHCKKWKIKDGYGYNYAVKHLPPFDKNIKWDSLAVEEFLNSFVKYE